MTPAEAARTSRTAQGLPPVVDDDEILSAIATLIAPTLRAHPRGQSTPAADEVASTDPINS